MKACTPLLILFWLAAAICPLSAQESKGTSPRAEYGLTIEEVHLLVSRLPGLKPAMTRKEVDDALGSDLLRKALIVTCHGQTSAYECTYYLRRGHNLHLAFDIDRNEFKGAVMRGEEWEREQKLKPDGTA
jgi:hypothetical protein